jgi:N-acetylmuramoyl-L-alanine amidase
VAAAIWRLGRAGVRAALLLLVVAAACNRPATAQTEIRKSPVSDEAGSAHAKGTAQSSAGLQTGRVTGPTVSLITGLAAEGDAASARIALATSGSGRLRLFLNATQDRLVVEGEGLGFSDDLAGSALPPGGLLTDFRFGQLANNDGRNEGRLVLELARPARLVHAQFTDGTLSFVLISDGLRADPPEPRVIDLAAVQTQAPPSTTAPGTAREPGGLPTRRPLIMIDPGHGGRDPGAVTDGGIYEKDVVLAVARRLSAALGSRGTYEVRLTRDGDQSVALDRRVQLSREARSDLFISLHADTFAGQPQAASVRGGAVYILSDKASDRTAESLAVRENAADTRLGSDAAAPAADLAVDAFLSDLAQRETRSFAHAVQASLIKSLALTMQLSRDPARGAAFRVLKQAETPAVLIELGYMSHAEDIQRLQSAEWQERVARALAAAIDGYFSTPRSALNRR